MTRTPTSDAMRDIADYLGVPSRFTVYNECLELDRIEAPLAAPAWLSSDEATEMALPEGKRLLYCDSLSWTWPKFHYPSGAFREAMQRYTLSLEPIGAPRRSPPSEGDLL